MRADPRPPDFVIVGAMKAGTTSLAANLSRHPALYVPAQEVHFCSRYWERGQDWYYRWFAVDAICGEKSPKYMLRRRFMSRLHSVAPEARIIASIRNPVARFLSHLNMKIERHNLPGTGRVTADYLRKNVLAHDALNRDMIDRGLYYRQIVRNILPLYPPERLYINVIEDATRDAVAGAVAASSYGKNLSASDPSGATRANLVRIAQFLECPETEFFTDQRVQIQVENIRHYSFEVADDVLELLHGIYEKPNKRLFELLGEERLDWRVQAAAPSTQEARENRQSSPDHTSDAGVV